MNPALAIQLGLMGTELLINLVTKIHVAKEAGTDLGADDIMDTIASALKFAGSTGKVKELSEDNINMALPIVKNIMSKLSGLRGLFNK